MHRVLKRAVWTLSGMTLCLVWLAFCATPLGAGMLTQWLQTQAGPRDRASQPYSPVMVVLGGGMRGPLRADLPDLDVLHASDRVWHAARLYHEGHASQLLLSGGVPDFGVSSEALAMRNYLTVLGVPDHAIWLETASRNTRENACFSATMLRAHGMHDVVLVTSAMHMLRARATFEQAGVHVLSAPTDFVEFVATRMPAPQDDGDAPWPIVARLFSWLPRLKNGELQPSQAAWRASQHVGKELFGAAEALLLGWTGQLCHSGAKPATSLTIRSAR